MAGAATQAGTTTPGAAAATMEAGTTLEARGAMEAGAATPGAAAATMEAGATLEAGAAMEAGAAVGDGAPIPAGAIATQAGADPEAGAWCRRATGGARAPRSAKRA